MSLRSTYRQLSWFLAGLALTHPAGAVDSVPTARPSAGAALTLEWTIPLTGVEGRIDHFSPDLSGHRLFVAALANNSVEVIDLRTRSVVHSIVGLNEPQGVHFVAETNRLYVANGGDGMLRILDGTTFAPLAAIRFDGDADNLRYDSTGRQLWVGHGDGSLAAVDVAQNAIVADIPLSAHPESFQLERNGSRIFANVPGAHQVTVVDRATEAVTANWSVGFAAANFPMTLDETNRRLIVGCRLPARLLVFDTSTGREVAKLALHGDCDDLFLDAAHRQIYASCGEGFIDVFTQTDADHYALKESIRTEAKARTCFVDGDRLYLAVPRSGARPAAVRCYRIAD